MPDIVFGPCTTSSTPDRVKEKFPCLDMILKRVKTGDASFKILASLVKLMHMYFRGSYEIDIKIAVNLRLFTEFTTCTAFIDEHIGVLVEAPDDDIVKTLKSIILDLKAGLNTAITTAKNLLENGVEMAEPLNKATQFASAWNKVATAIEAFVNALGKNPAADFPGTDYRVITTTTPDENSSYDPSHSSISSDDIAAVIGPPAETLKNLKDLRDSTGRVIDQLNDILSQREPFLKQFTCPHPDGFESDLCVVTRHYRTEYLKLKSATLPLVRILRSYAEKQAYLLRRVARDDEVRDPNNDIPLTTFIKTNVRLVEGYNKKAEEVCERSTELKNEWVGIRDIVTARIDKCEVEATKFLSELERVKGMKMEKCDEDIRGIKDDKLDEKGNIIQCGLFAVATVAFTVAFKYAFTAIAFSPGGMLAALFALILGSGALTFGYKMYSELKKLWNDFFNITKNTKGNNDSLLSRVNSVEKSLSAISRIWTIIANVLCSLNDYLTRISISGPEGFCELNIGIDTAIANWATVKNAADAYTYAVA